MSSLSTNDILHLAKLANLKLTDEEIKTLTPQLSKILDYFEELKTLEINVKPTSQASLENVLREDQVDQTRILLSDEALSGTEKVHNGAFVVPQVIDKDQ